MMKFFTKYDRVRQVPSIMDRCDNVDRLSYVDSTKMVQRMILEGQNLNSYRAACQRSAMYKLEEAFVDEKVPPMPVYTEDPVIVESVLKIYDSELKSSLDSRQVEQEASPVEASKVDTPLVSE